MNKTIGLDRFCINRKIAPSLEIESFFKLVKRMGLSKVELRNDMQGGSVTDNLSGLQVRELAQHHGLEIVTINAVYPFNQLTDAVIRKTEGLLRDAQETGAHALVLCPLNDGTAISHKDTLAALRYLAPLFEEFDIQGLVEPLGFPQSSLRSASQTLDLIREAHIPFKIVLDTFHHHLYEKAEEEFQAGINIEQIGLVHLSGVTDARPTHFLTDEERIMLTSDDLLKSRDQVLRLEKMGYTGIYAFEPFSSILENWSESDIEKEIRQSINLLNS